MQRLTVESYSSVYRGKIITAAAGNYTTEAASEYGKEHICRSAIHADQLGFMTTKFGFRRVRETGELFSGDIPATA